LKDFLSKEVAFYNKYLELKTTFFPSITTFMSNDSSIDKCTENFIVSLQTNFSSTVHTIIKTSEKLKKPTSNDSCAYCLQYFKKTNNHIYCPSCFDLLNE
jgi:cytoplasmic tRNA 2-thiolation protein 2